MDLTYCKAQSNDFERINELFIEMLMTIYNTDQVDGYSVGDLDRFFDGIRLQAQLLLLEPHSVSGSRAVRTLVRRPIPPLEPFGFEEILLHSKKAEALRRKRETHKKRPLQRNRPVRSSHAQRPGFIIYGGKIRQEKSCRAYGLFPRQGAAGVL